MTHHDCGYILQKCNLKAWVWLLYSRKATLSKYKNCQILQNYVKLREMKLNIIKRECNFSHFQILQISVVYAFLLEYVILLCCIILITHLFLLRLSHICGLYVVMYMLVCLHICVYLCAYTPTSIHV